MKGQTPLRQCSIRTWGSGWATQNYDPAQWMGAQRFSQKCSCPAQATFTASKSHMFTFAIRPLHCQRSKWAPAASLLPTIAASSAPAIKQCLARSCSHQIAKYPSGASDLDLFFTHKHFNENDLLVFSLTMQLLQKSLFILTARARKEYKAPKLIRFARQNCAPVPRPRCCLRRKVTRKREHAAHVGHAWTRWPPPLHSSTDVRSVLRTTQSVWHCWCCNAA